MEKEKALLCNLYPEEFIAHLQEIVRRFPHRPSVALVTGSGWDGCVEGEVEGAITLSELNPSLRTGVPGHRGVLEVMRLPEGLLLVVGGRLHLYEGYGLSEILLPIVFAHFLEVRTIILTNASGSLSPFLPPGSILVLADQVDWTFVPDSLGRVHFDEGLQDLALRCAGACGLQVTRGVYVGVLGPSFETAAEIRMLGFLGGHAVGMSTVKEAKCAANLGMRVLGLSLVTNWGTGLSSSPLSHEEVLSLAGAKKPVIRSFLHHLVAEILHEDCREP